MQLELTDIAPTGEAIGRHEGMVIFVPYSLPGELVEIELVHRRRSYARARLIKVLRPSPNRVVPACPYFGACGGCEWQHVDIETQRSFKTQAIKEQFKRIGKLPDVDVRPCLGADQPYHYRNHTQLIVSPQGHPGFNKAGTNQVVEIDACPITDDRLNDLLVPHAGSPSAFEQAIQQARQHGILLNLRDVHLRAGSGAHERMILLEEQDGRSTVAYGQTSLHERVGENDYAISPASFFQVNTAVATLLVQEVLSSLALSGHEHVLDLYCGVGLFSLPISVKAGFVLGVESNPVAIRDARLNLATSSHAQFMVADVADALTQDEITSHTWDAVVMDPPRAGVSYAALQRLLALHIPQIVYVSCDPATLARDVRICVDQGYTVKRIQPFDMFPQTHHVECVVTLSK